jgi:hypothetical protein
MPGGVVALGLAAFAAAPVNAQTQSGDWPGALKGRYRQVVDAYETNSGFPLAFVYTFLKPNDPADTSAVLVLRHGAFPIALNDAIWQKYKIGESFTINDPETKAAAAKNPTTVYCASAVIKVRTIAKMNGVIQNKIITRRIRFRGTDTFGLSVLSEKIICAAPVVFERIILEPSLRFFLVASLSSFCEYKDKLTS